MTKLERFINVDHLAQDRAVKISAAVGFAWFMFAETLMGITHENSAYSTIGMVFSVYLWRVWSYCHNPTKVAQVETHAVSRRLAMATVAAGVFVLLSLVPVPVIEGAILERRLLKLTRNSTLSPQQAKEVANILQTAATQEPVPKLSDTARVRVREAVKTSAIQNPHTPFTDAANALVSYVREVHSTSQVPTEAAIAMDSAFRHYRVAIPEVFPTIVIDRSEAGAAISAFTRAIELSGSDTTLRADALLSRADLYSYLNQPDKALMDIDAAEKLGAADLSDIVTAQSFALVTRNNPDDLKLVVKLYTLALQLPAPNLPVAAQTPVYWISLYASRSLAYFRLGMYLDTINDCKKILDLVKQLPSPFELAVLHSYVLIIRSYLYLGDIAAATQAAYEWGQSSNDPRAARVRELIQSNPSEAQKVLSFYPVQD